jgi:macrodomain Ter protein organizer (MatP/YcbG family)
MRQMEKFEKIELELDADVVNKLKKIAKEKNATLEEVVRFVVEEMLSEDILINKFVDILNKDKKIDKLYTIINKRGNAIARVRPLD